MEKMPEAIILGKLQSRFRQRLYVVRCLERDPEETSYKKAIASLQAEIDELIEELERIERKIVR